MPRNAPPVPRIHCACSTCCARPGDPVTGGDPGGGLIPSGGFLSHSSYCLIEGAPLKCLTNLGSSHFFLPWFLNVQHWHVPNLKTIGIYLWSWWLFFSMISWFHGKAPCRSRQNSEIAMEWSPQRDRTQRFQSEYNVSWLLIIYFSEGLGWKHQPVYIYVHILYTLW
jgi:hypothetical protein